jgi:4-amino-4-deoxy-L-arabinose transferase-like glycosyltransferase
MKKGNVETAASPVLFKPWITTILVVFLFIAGMGIRLLDLTDLPNDFYLPRQYRSLIIARGMYYAGLPDAPQWQREIAVAQWKDYGLIEPPIMEGLVTATYHLVGEHIWVGRIWASLFWLTGGLAICLLAKELSLRWGGILALAFYAFQPFGLTASQAFMPDPLMTAMIIWSIWSLIRWEKRRTWRSAVLAGVLTGFAILVKSVAVFILLGAAIGLVVNRKSIRNILADGQVWAVAGITAIPTILYYIYGLFIAGSLGGQFALRFIPALLSDPSFYARWFLTAISTVGFAAFFFSVLGIFLYKHQPIRSLLIGAWVGYVCFGIAFPFHFITHQYYHLPLIPIVTISLIPVFDAILDRVASQPGWFIRTAVGGLLVLAVGVSMWNERNYLVGTDYRHEETYWRDLGNLIGHDKKVIELSGDYGVRLAYFGWINATQWPNSSDENLRSLAGLDQPDFASAFAEMTGGRDLFVILSQQEWDDQPALQDYLTSNYPLVDQGDGYWIYNLQP